MVKLIDLTNEVFGKLTVIDRAKNDSQGRSRWNCKCLCGNETTVSSWNLRSGMTTSCGCFQKEKTSIVKTTHGMTHSSEYHTWIGIKQRCYNKNHKRYKDWGGRGIRMSKSWYHSFEQFIKDIGERPSNKHSIERIDNNKGYSKNNCIWATAKEQSNNRRKRGDIKTHKRKGYNRTLKSGEIIYVKPCIVSR